MKRSNLHYEYKTLEAMIKIYCKINHARRQDLCSSCNSIQEYALNKIKRYAKQRMDRLSYIANTLKNLSDIIISIQRNKVKNG